MSKYKNILYLDKNNKLVSINKKTIILSIILTLFCTLNSLKSRFGDIAMALLYSICFIVLLHSIPYFFHRYSQWTYNWNRFFLLYTIIIGTITPILFWYQPIIDTIHCSIGIWGIWGMFFFLFEYKYSLKEIENAIIISSLTYFILYILFFSINYSKMSTIVGDDFSTNHIRFFWGVCDLSICAFYISLNKIINKNSNIYYITLFTSLLVIIFLQTRQLYLWIGLTTFLYLFKRLDFKVFIRITLIILLCLPVFIPIINGVIDKTEKQAKELKINKEEYIRIREYKYYYTELNKSIFQNIFGNGKPQDGSRFYEEINKNSPGPEADVGYAGIYFYWGIIGLLFFSFLLYKVIKEKIPENYYWIKLVIILLFLYNIFSFAFRFCFASIFLYCIFLIQRRRLRIKLFIYEKYKYNNRLFQFRK